MSRETFRVTFQPEGRNAFMLGGTKLVEAAGQAGIILNQPCGGEGTCGKCRVEVLQNAPPPTDAERQHLTDAELAAGWRLACQLRIGADLVISVPQEARFFEQTILAEGEGHRYPFQPNLRKRLLTVPAPAAEEQGSELERLKAALRDEGLSAAPPLLRALPSILREAGPQLTAVLEGDRMQWLEAGDTTDRLWGVAFDIGTTSLVGILVNLNDGVSGAVAARTNPQVHFGDDVVSRI
ncbi:MAG: 2Fe-2S iron-sulfur cluster-binding protein, partial [Planctomycetota bacterium]